jgi:hypothetical protein
MTLVSCVDPWTLGDNAPAKRVVGGPALIHVHREYREMVVRRGAQRPLALTNEVVVEVASEHVDPSRR